MADLLSMVMDLFSTEEPPELLGHRIQKSLQLILAGLEDRDTLSGANMETLRRELRMLLQLERIQIATAEMDKAELVLQYMLRPSFEECLHVWFGKSEPTRKSRTASAPTSRWRRRATTTIGRSMWSTRACWWRW
jgi:hypothetical protein